MERVNGRQNFDAQRTEQALIHSCRPIWDRFSLTKSMNIVVYVDEFRMSRLNCTDAHAHMDLSCSHMA